MLVRSHKRFDKQFQKLSPKLQEKVKNTIKEFRKNPYEAQLYNHPLRGRLERKRAISVTSNVRIIFITDAHYEMITFLDVGTHNQVY